MFQLSLRTQTIGLHIRPRLVNDAHLVNRLTRATWVQTLVLTCQSLTDQIGTRRKINGCKAKTSNAVLSRQRRVQRSFQGQLYTQDESDLLGSHLISTAHIQIPPGSFCAVSTFYLKKLILLFFSLVR